MITIGTVLRAQAPTKAINATKKRSRISVFSLRTSRLGSAMVSEIGNRNYDEAVDDARIRHLVGQDESVEITNGSADQHDEDYNKRHEYTISQLVLRNDNAANISILKFDHGDSSQNS